MSGVGIEISRDGKDREFIGKKVKIFWEMGGR